MENLFDTDTDYEDIDDNDWKCPHCDGQLYGNNETGTKDCLECGYWGN